MLPPVSQVKCDAADYLLFSSPDYISNVLLKTGSWESHLQMLASFFYRAVEAPFILDIGANLGAFSVPVAKEIQGMGGTVFGFEPQRIIYYQLCGNIILNRLDNYFAFHQAVGDREGTVEIPETDFAKSDNAGGFSLNNKFNEIRGLENFMKPTSSQVPMVTLDSLQISRAPALIKIDVEGCELNVLKGGVNYLENNNFPPILFEAWDLDGSSKKRERCSSSFTCSDMRFMRSTERTSSLNIPAIWFISTSFRKRVAA
jgi:FkbM family methyltransferase